MSSNIPEFTPVRNKIPQIETDKETGKKILRYEISVDDDPNGYVDSFYENLGDSDKQIEFAQKASELVENAKEAAWDKTSFKNKQEFANYYLNQILGDKDSIGLDEFFQSAKDGGFIQNEEDMPNLKTTVDEDGNKIVSRHELTILLGAAFEASNYLEKFEDEYDIDIEPVNETTKNDDIPYDFNPYDDTLSFEERSNSIFESDFYSQLGYYGLDTEFAKKANETFLKAKEAAWDKSIYENRDDFVNHYLDTIMKDNESISTNAFFQTAREYGFISEGDIRDMKKAFDDDNKIDTITKKELSIVLNTVYDIQERLGKDKK